MRSSNCSSYSSSICSASWSFILYMFSLMFVSKISENSLQISAVLFLCNILLSYTLPCKLHILISLSFPSQWPQLKESVRLCQGFLYLQYSSGYFSNVKLVILQCLFTYFVSLFSKNPVQCYLLSVLRKQLLHVFLLQVLVFQFVFHL